MYPNNTTTGVCYSLYCAVASTELVLEVSSTEVSAFTASLLVHEYVTKGWLLHKCNRIFMHRTLNILLNGSARLYSWLPGGQIWIEYNVQTQQFGPFKSADGQIALTIDN